MMLKARKMTVFVRRSVASEASKTSGEESTPSWGGDGSCMGPGPRRLGNGETRPTKAPQRPRDASLFDSDEPLNVRKSVSFYHDFGGESISWAAPFQPPEA